jgi:hypothetical protein
VKTAMREKLWEASRIAPAVPLNPIASIYLLDHAFADPVPITSSTASAATSLSVGHRGIVNLPRPRSVTLYGSGNHRARKS